MARFSAQMNAWTEKAKRRAADIVRQSAQDVIEDAQETVARGGRMPVDTGFLRNSLVSDLNGAQVAQGEGGYVLALAQMQGGDVIRFGWTADYALHVEYGARGIPGRHFVGVAASRWQEFVDAAARRAG